MITMVTIFALALEFPANATLKRYRHRFQYGDSSTCHALWLMEDKQGDEETNVYLAKQRKGHGHILVKFMKISVMSVGRKCRTARTHGADTLFVLCASRSPAIILGSLNFTGN